MNWDAIGAIGELIGALAVVITLVFLVLQVRHNTRAMNESNRLERASAIDRHADSIKRSAGYTNRVFGETDEGHNTFSISPATLARDDSEGVIIRPAHVHKALRNYLGIGSNPLAQLFQFGGIEDFDFFA